MRGTMNEVHATTGVAVTLFVIAAAGAAIAIGAIALDRYLDWRARRQLPSPPRAIARDGKQRES